MSKCIKFGNKILAGLCLGLAFFSSTVVFAEGKAIYYDSFYKDYYKSYPDAKPKAKEVKTTQIAYSSAVPYTQYQTNAAYSNTYNPYNSVYQVDHGTDKWQVDVEYRRGYGQFMFELDVGSILNWDEVETNEFIYTVSRDFMFKNRQYIFNASFAHGDAKTDRTSDDDIFNEAHIISLGRGSADLSEWSLSLGMRNVYRLGGFDVSPVIGFKQKKQDFEMRDHTVPAPFFLEYFCSGATNTNPVCALGLNLSTQGLTTADVYYLDENGNKIVGPIVSGDMNIPGTITITDANGNQHIFDNLVYNIQIYDQDFCYVSNSGKTACINRLNADGSSNLLSAFGGVSSTFTTDGPTHIYKVEWTGPFIGVNLERMFSEREALLIYAEFFKPSYEVWGNWPHRVDWAHDPSFIDDGGDAWGVNFEATYKYKIRENIELTLGGFFEYLKVEDGDTTQYYSDGYVDFLEGALKEARWKSFGFSLGVSFKI